MAHFFEEEIIVVYPIPIMRCCLRAGLLTLSRPSADQTQSLLRSACKLAFLLSINGRNGQPHASVPIAQLDPDPACFAPCLLLKHQSSPPAVNCVPWLCLVAFS